MKILVLTDLFPEPANPNHGIFIYQWAKHLSQKVDLTVLQTVWTTKQQLLTSESLEIFRKNFSNYSDQFIWRQIPIKIPYYDRLWLRALFFHHSVKKYFKKYLNDFDLLIGQMGVPGGFVAVKLACQYNKKTIVGLRGSDVTSYPFQPILRRMVLWTYRRADILVTVSNDLRQKLIDLDFDSSKIEVIHNGIDSFFSPLPKTEARRYLNLSNTRIIIFIGYLIARKDWLTLIEGVKIFSQITACKCYLIGTGEDRLLIEKKIRDEKIEDRIILIGNVAHHVLKYWYNAADVLCLPSKREGIPNVVLESFACGIPVVASNIAGNCEIVKEGKNGYLFNVGDKQSLVKSLQKVFEMKWNPDIIVNSVRNFTWQKNTLDYIRIIKNLHNITGH